MTSFFEVVARQRACRRFSDEPVPDDVLVRVLRAAIMAPSAENRQPWVFVVVRDESARAEIGRLTRTVWESGGRAHSEGRLPPGLLADVDRGATGGISAAPVVVVVGADTERCLPATIGSSVFPAVQNLLLAATAVGLGSALTTLATVMADDLRRVMELPEHVVPVAVVPLGWPAVELGPPRREPLAQKVHDERYGRPAPWAG
ncbi:MAG: nitroreductase family protein [Actinomycetota bacterium]